MLLFWDNMEIVPIVLSIAFRTWQIIVFVPY